jgi:hypothetical protein
VHFHWQLATLRRLEHALALRKRKADALAEHVDCIDEAFVGERRQHAFADFGDVLVGTAGKFRRQRMRAEKRRVDRYRITLAKTSRDAQHLALTGQIEAIAGFDFDGCDAFSQQRFETRGRLLEQRVFVGGARCAYRRDDAAALLRDLFVAHARKPLREFVSTLSAIHEMRVAIDKARRHPRAAQVFARPGFVFFREFMRRAKPGDLAVAHGDRRVVEGLIRIALRAELQVMPDGLLHRLLIAM